MPSNQGNNSIGISLFASLNDRQTVSGYQRLMMFGGSLAAAQIDFGHKD